MNLSGQQPNSVETQPQPVQQQKGQEMYTFFRKISFLPNYVSQCNLCDPALRQQLEYFFKNHLTELKILKSTKNTYKGKKYSLEIGHGVYKKNSNFC